MTQGLELSDIKFKITVINMLGTLMEEVDNGQQHMGNVSKEIKKNYERMK